MSTPGFGPSNPSLNPFISNVLDRMTNGKEMRRLNVERQALLTSLKATGLAQPATILNFNPIPLALDGGVGFKVPSILDESVKDEDRLHLKFEGREYKATIVTIREPKTFTQIKDVKVDDEIPSGIYDMKACKQIEIAHCFYVAYTMGVLGSATGVGGVVVFEGDRKVLTREEKGKRVQIKVPTFIRLANNTREYFTEPADFEESVAKALRLQKAYSNIQTQQAQAYWDQGDEERKNITPIHRLWHQYEIDMGWREIAAPWVTLVHENAVTCEGCGTQKKRATAFFCHVCARPYDVLEAYLAGELPVDHAAMNRLKDADWATVRKEEARRKKVREGTV